MMGFPQVSCVIPCHECAATLERAVASVLAQSVPVDEIILVDDCCPNGSGLVIDKIAMQHRQIKTIRLSANSGPSYARNRGWDVAKAEWIAFLDADDAWHPKKLEIQLRLLDLFPDIQIVGHLCDVNDPTAPFNKIVLDDTMLKKVSRKIVRSSLLLRNPWSTPTVLLRADLPFRFDEDQWAAEDYLLWADILLSGYKGMRIDLPLGRLFKARYGAAGLSERLWRMERGELTTLRKLRQHGHFGVATHLALSVYSLAKYVRRALVGP